MFKTGNEVEIRRSELKGDHAVTDLQVGEDRVDADVELRVHRDNQCQLEESRCKHGDRGQETYRDQSACVGGRTKGDVSWRAGGGPWETRQVYGPASV